jgi:hypothetical protein
MTIRTLPSDLSSSGRANTSDHRPTAISGRRVLGWTTVVASAAYFLSDAIEAAHGGFFDAQLLLTLAAEAAVPIVVIGLYLVQRPAISPWGKYGAVVYAYTFVYFTGTVVYALARNIADFEQLTHDLDPVMTIHGVVMVGAGIAFGLATYRAGVLPRWTGLALAVGVVLTAISVGPPAVVQLAAVGVRDAAFIGIGIALIDAPARPSRRASSSSG